MSNRKHWLFKSEPTAYSFTDLLNDPDRTVEWDGVRNYQVRNFMRDEMKVGDGVLFFNTLNTATSLPVITVSNLASGQGGGLSAAGMAQYVTVPPIA